MACREKLLLCLGLFLVASCHCTSLTRLKANRTLSQNQGEGSSLCHGRLLIGKPLQVKKAAESSLEVDTDYQADMDWGQPQQQDGQQSLKLKSDAASVELLLKMEPKVECTRDSMKLHVQGASTPGSLVFVDRGVHLSPLPVSKLPPSCGYTFRSTRRDLVLVAPYDGCFVSQEEDNYVLPLLWLGIAVRMSCPSVRQPAPNPPMVTCHAEGMKVEWTGIAAAKITVNLNGTWESLTKASSKCRFGVVEHPEGVIISVHYKPCLQNRDGIYALELAGEGQTKISCPFLSSAPSDPAKTQSKNTGPSTHPSKSSPSNPTEPSVPQVPSFPQNPEIPNQGPKDTYQPQLPYIPYPNFYYPYNINPGPTPTVNPTPPSYPFYVKQTTHPSTPRPEQKPATAPPLVQTNDQRWQHFYPFYPPKPETSPREPPVQPPPPDQVKQPFLPNPFNHLMWPPKEPVKQTTSQPEGQGFRPQYPSFYPPLPASEAPKTESPYPQYPKNPEKMLPEEPKLPVSEKPQGQVYQQFFPYNFFPQGPYQMPGSISHPAPTAAPKGQGQLFTTPVQPGTSKPADLPGKGAPQPQLPQQPVSQPIFPKPENQPSPHPGATQGKVQLPYYPFYLWPGPENQPTEKSPQQETPPGQVGHPSYPQPGPPGQAQYPSYPEPDPGQIYQPFHPFYQPEKLTTVPKPPTTDAAKGQGHDPSYHRQPQMPLVGTNGDKTPNKPVQQPSPVKPPHSQGPFHFNPFYSQQPWNPPAATVPPATSMQVTTPASGQQPPQAAYCSALCPPGFPGCCLQIAFHQHLHHIVPPGPPGSKDTSPVYPGLQFIPSLIPQMAYSGYTSRSKVPSTSAPSSPQFPATGSEEQPHVPPPGGNPATFPGSSPSKSAFPKQLHQFVANSQYPSWPYQPQNVKLPDPPQTQQQQQFYYRFPSKIQPPGNEPQNPLVQNEQISSKNPNLQDDKSSAGFMNNPIRSNYYAFMTQNLPKQQNKRTANKQQPNKDLSMSEPMLQDAQVPPNGSMASNTSTQLQQSGLKEHGVNAHSTKSFVLLQHGPPGRKPAPLQPSRLWKGIYTSNHDYTSSPDKSAGLALPFYASTDPHLVPLPWGPSFSAAQLTPLAPGEVFQQWRSTADQKATGLKEPIQKEGGIWR